MSFVLSDRVAGQLRDLLRAHEAAGGGRSSGRGGELIAFVRCDSATAIGGNTILSQCYPATVLAPAADVALPPEVDEGSAVLLSLIDSAGVAAVPVANAVYLCVLSGEVESDGNSVITGRPRAFGVVASVPAGDIPSGQSSGSVSTISFDDTWTDATSFVLPDAGTYLVFFTTNSQAQISAGAPGRLYLRLCTVSGATRTPVSPYLEGAVAQVTGVAVNATTTFAQVVSVLATTTLVIQGMRKSGPTWTISWVTVAITDAPGLGASADVVGYIRLTNVSGGSGPTGPAGATGPAAAPDDANIALGVSIFGG